MESTRPIRALIRGLDALTVLNLRNGATVSEIAQEIKNLNLTEHSKQVLIASIRKVSEDIKRAESTIKKTKEKIDKKPAAPEKRELNKRIAEAKAVLAEIEEKFHLSVVDIKRSYQTISIGASAMRNACGPRISLRV